MRTAVKRMPPTSRSPTTAQSDNTCTGGTPSRTR